MLPLYTIALAEDGAWFGTNFSCLAAVGGKAYWEVLLWGMLMAVFFGVVLERAAHRLPCKMQRAVLFLLELALICLALGLPLPYRPEWNIECAWVHTVLTALSCVWMMGAMLLVSLSLWQRGVKHFLWCWWAIVWGCVVLFCVDGIISSALEVYFTLAAAQLARSLWCWDDT